MKDLPHHMQKLNRRIIRSAHREELEEETWQQELGPSPFAKKQTPNELKKIAKRETRKARATRTPTPRTPEEKNSLQRKRVPIFDRLNDAKPKVGARPTHKKTPRI